MALEYVGEIFCLCSARKVIIVIIYFSIGWFSSYDNDDDDERKRKKYFHQIDLLNVWHLYSASSQNKINLDGDGVHRF